MHGIGVDMGVMFMGYRLGEVDGRVDGSSNEGDDIL